MKNLILTALLAVVFTIAASFDASAQQSLGNRTNCDVEMAFEYGPTGSCTAPFYGSVIVPAYTVIPAPIPAGMEIFHAKGTYAAGGCGAFYVGLPCSTYPANDAVSCGILCGNFQASYWPSWGIVVYH